MFKERIKDWRCC